MNWDTCSGLYRETHSARLGHRRDRRRSRPSPRRTAGDADRVIWTGLGRVPDAEKDVPSIVVEFVSKRRRDVLRDYEEKRDEYLAAGVQQYWIIDRFRRIMTVYRQDAAGPTYEIVERGRDATRPTSSPGSSCRSRKLLAKADQWKREESPPQATPQA